jgi:hypothetical protein
MILYVICTEVEPAGKVTHFRFENGGTDPEWIMEMDFSDVQPTPKWTEGQGYYLAIDTEQAPEPNLASAGYIAKVQCRVVPGAEYQLVSVDPTQPISAAHARWDKEWPDPDAWIRDHTYRLQLQTD